MLYLVPFLIVIGYTSAENEGDSCMKDGVPGVCVNVNQCQTAIDDIQNKKSPQICTFDYASPIVCCIDHRDVVAQPTAPPEPVATTTRRSLTTTTEYTPKTYDYEDLEPAAQCQPIHPSMTSPKTGKKAWDKCLEYQEQLVYPCVHHNIGGPSRSLQCHHEASDLIVGGTAAKRHEFPHMVMLGYGNQVNYLQWRCGGSLISDRFVLTAGHCVVETAIGRVNYVLVGALLRNDSADNSKIYKVKRIIKHPKYKLIFRYNDIALLETKKQIQLDQFTVPACLHVGDPVDDRKFYATGWGHTAFGGAASEVLQKVMLFKFRSDECAVIFPKDIKMRDGFDNHTQICFGDKNKSSDTCQGDSGGPLQVMSKKIYCMYVIVGVTSFGKACGIAGQPGIYTRVESYLPWIESIVWP